MHQIIFNRDLLDWPNEWFLHLLRTCELYFDKEIKFVSGTFYMESDDKSRDFPTTSDIGVFYFDKFEESGVHVISFRPMFLYDSKLYLGIFTRDNGDIVSGSIVRIMALVESDQIEILESAGADMVNISDNNFVVKPLGLISGETPYDCAIEAEKLILKDKDDDDDRGGSQDSPTPKPSLALNL